MNVLRKLLPIIAIVIAAAVEPAAAGSASIEDFVGSYYGVGIVEDSNGVTHPSGIRESSVVVRKATGGGFALTWSAIRHVEALKEPRSKTTTLWFLPTATAGAFAAAAEGGASRHRAWARIDGATLSVYVPGIGTHGGTELQQWDRTLAGKTLEMTYRRVRDGQTAREIRLTLVREQD